MKIRLERLDVVALVLIASTAIVTAIVFPDLPPRIATHFDARGVANGWSDRSFGASIFLVTALVTWALVRFVHLFARDRTAAIAPTMPAIALAMVVCMLGIHLLLIASALGLVGSMGRPLAMILGATWFVLSFVLAKVRRNRFVGIRTPWTLASDENWLRTHRVASQTFAICGLLALVLGMLSDGGSVLAVALCVIAPIIPIAYSWRIARTLPPE